MNTIIKSGMLFLSIFLFSNFSAQTKTFKAKVEGNCGMCKDRIETVAKSDKNVKSAVWSVSKKTLTVSYDASKTDKKAILKSIAEVGHDNEMFRASSKVYDDLEVCCQYDRPDNSKKLAKNCDPKQVCELK
ncbi:heavy-metal-associated domain-containing protein [Chryseobacterium sp. FH1]|uniref:heavy-metal-associated domain-containing protein n=1 Tax=Chryseobacterium sp. FH1 TaxID=1233951 RepID=UPI00054D3099|nr:heavy-metal-associated domain-containing protein [Chryseobacterium sp. FH1]